jgi:hypothetical protein
MPLLYPQRGINNSMRTPALVPGSHCIYLTWQYAVASLFWILRKPNSLLYKSKNRQAFSYLRFPLAAPQLISSSNKIDVVEIKRSGRSQVRFAGPGRGHHEWAL